MTISNQMTQSLYERILKDYEALNQEIQDTFTDEARELKSFIQRKLRQLEMLRVALDYLKFDVVSNEPMDVRDTLRQLKLEMRFARRRWKRQLVSQQRMARNQARRNHVPQFAA